MDWSHEDIEALRRLWQPGQWNPELLAALPGRSKLGIQRRAHQIGLTRPMESASTAWSAAEDAILREYYPQEGASVVHRLTGRSRKAVKIRAARIGVQYIRG